jgi:hypothetical protein
VLRLGTRTGKIGGGQEKRPGSGVMRRQVTAYFGLMTAALIFVLASIGPSPAARWAAAAAPVENGLTVAQSLQAQPDVLGDVHFASSCNDEARQELNRGVALLQLDWCLDSATLLAVTRKPT